MNDTLWKQFKQWWRQKRCFHCYWGGKDEPVGIWKEYSKSRCVDCGKTYDPKHKRQYFLWIGGDQTVDFNKPYARSVTHVEKN